MCVCILLSYTFILGPVVILTCYPVDGIQFWCLNWVEGSSIKTINLPASLFIPRTPSSFSPGTFFFKAFKSTQSDEQLYFSWGSGGLSLHKHDMKRIFSGFCPPGIWGCKNLQSRSPPPPITPLFMDSPICLAWSGLFFGLTSAISTVLVQFIYSFDSKLSLLPGWQCSRAPQSKYSISSVSPSPLYIIF